MTNVFIVRAVPEDRRGDGILGVYSSWDKAEQGLAADGLRSWSPERSNADDPDNEIPRQPDERVISTYTIDYRVDNREAIAAARRRRQEVQHGNHPHT